MQIADISYLWQEWHHLFHILPSKNLSSAELQKRADRADQLVLIFLGEKLVGANFYAFCNYVHKMYLKAVSSDIPSLGKQMIMKEIHCLVVVEGKS